MEAELEGMLVGAWIHGDRTKLMLRVESLQRELSLIKSGRLTQREAFEAQKKEFVRRLVDIKAEHERIVRELTSRATGEERRRTICEKRMQDLKGEVLLLKEKLQVAAMKNREMEKAYKRERTSNNRLRHRELKRSTGRSDDGESVPAPAASQDRSVAVDGTLPQPSFGPNRAGCGSGNVSGVRGERAEGAEELRVVERLVAGLIEQSLRPGSAVRQFQVPPALIPPTRFCVTEESTKRESPSAPSDHGGGGSSRKEQEEKQQRNAVSAAGATKADVAQTSDSEPHTESLRDVQSQEKASSEKETVNVDLALSRIHALTGMMRAQEEIETLLGQQLGELKHKQAEESKRMWQLVTR
ncbi:unnamed protein product [Ectocarpus fasciculatus]